MTLNSSITQSVVSVTMTGFALSAFAIDIHAVSDFGDYVIDNGTSVRFVQVDDSLQNNDFTEILEIISKAQSRALLSVNREMIVMYWEIGRIVSEKTASAG